jgi:hypothetical protein
MEKRQAGAAANGGRSRPVRWRMAASIVTVLSLLGAACSSGSSDDGQAPAQAEGGASEGQESAVTDADLEAMLLVVSDLPTGWAVDNSPDESDSNAPSCLENAQVDEEEASAQAEAEFAKDGNLPVLFEALSYGGENASKWFEQGKAAFDSCTDVSFTSDGEKVEGTIGAMSFPTVGDESAAYAMNFTVQGLRLSFPIVIARKGDILAIIGLGDLGSPDSQLLEDLATRALSKVDPSVVS